MKLAAPFLFLASQALAAGQLPADIVGAWGLSDADCAAGEGSEGYFRITETGMEFYESTGTLQSVAPAEGKPGVIATIAFAGEGETWTHSMYLETTEGGTMLNRVDVGEDAQATPFSYVSCD